METMDRHKQLAYAEKSPFNFNLSMNYECPVTFFALHFDLATWLPCGRSNPCISSWPNTPILSLNVSRHLRCVLSRCGTAKNRKWIAAWVGWWSQRDIQKILHIFDHWKFSWSQFIFFYIRYQYYWIAFWATPPHSLFLLLIVNVGQRIWVMVMYDCQQMITFSRGRH